MWDPRRILVAAAHALTGAERLARLEQRVQGIDALAEVALHAVLSRAFCDAGFGVEREQPYPAEWRRGTRRGRGRARAIATDSARLRCDIVLLAEPRGHLLDELHGERAEIEERAARRGTLFESARSPEAEPPSNLAVRAEDAFWIELKCVGQYAYVDGVPGPNRTYSSELLRGLPADLRKLASDPKIEHGAALLVHFGADAAVADHDLSVLIARCVDRGLVTRSPHREQFAIADRIGNGVCTLLLIESGTLARAVAEPVKRRRLRERRPEREDQSA